MAELNPEHICALLSLLRDAPYFSLLGIRVSDVQKGYARVEMDVERKLMNPFGSVHGGRMLPLWMRRPIGRPMAVWKKARATRP